MNPAHDLYLILLGIALAIALHRTATWYRRWIWPELRRAQGRVIVVASPEQARETIERLLASGDVLNDLAKKYRAQTEALTQERAGYIAERDALASEVRRLRGLYEPKQPDITTTTA